MSLTSLRFALAAAFIGLITASAVAAPMRIDDAGTHLSPPNLRMQWRDWAPSGNARQMEAQARLAVRLNTRAYAGRNARIYLVMPQDVGGSLVMQWQGRGQLIAGRIAPGERTLIFQGRVPGPTLEDQWTLQLVADGEWISGSRRLDCSFELEWD